MPAAGTAAVAIAAGLEFAFGEPPERLHPVAWLGRAVAWTDREWARPSLAGVAIAIAMPLFAAAGVGVAVAIAGAVHAVIGTVVAAGVLFSTTSLRMLLSTARKVIATSGRDPRVAREELRALAGRDASALSAEELRSAAVESVAENLADGLLAPLGAFALLATVSLPLAAATAAWVKTVNTLDSMLGYPSKPHGSASARLDDAVMWFPARASAGLIALAARQPGVLTRTRRWADVPSSPNSGWPMATLAAVLNVRLEKPGTYTLNPIADLPDVERGMRGVRVVGIAGALCYLIGGAIAWF